jgi:hypothetical protein
MQGATCRAATAIFSTSEADSVATSPHPSTPTCLICGATNARSWNGRGLDISIINSHRRNTTAYAKRGERAKPKC